jgi:hypothetical protein
LTARLGANPCNLIKGHHSGRLGKEKKFYSLSHRLPFIYTKKSFIFTTTGKGGVCNDDDGGYGGGDDNSVGESKPGAQVIKLDF